MNALFDNLPLDAVEIRFFQSSSQRFDPGWIHEKVEPFCIIAQALEGEYGLECGGRSARVHGQEAFLAPADVPLRITHRGNAQCKFSARWLHFSCVLYSAIDIGTILEVPLKVGAADGRKFSEIMEELNAPTEGLLSAIRRHELIWRSVQLFCAVSRLRSDALERLGAGRRLQPLLGYLRENLQRPVTVAGMAARTGMSESRFFAFFHSQMGCAPQAYFKRLRLDAAATRLLHSDALLKQIAEETGFANPFHLSREFKRRFGESPGRYRRLRR